MRIAVIGPYPKPFGGISVHLRNFTLYCQKYHPKKVDLSIYNTNISDEQIDTLPNVKKMPSLPLKLNLFYRVIWLFKSFFIQKPEIIHFNGSPNWTWRVLTVLLAKIMRAKSILSIHGAGLKRNIFSKLPIKSLSISQKFIWFFIRHCDHIICDNPYQVRNLKSLGYPNERISLISEFIPPIVKESDYKKIPEYILEYYKNNDVNLYGMGWLAKYNGIDVYGIDMMLDLMVKIEESYPNSNIGLILKVIESNQNLIEQLKKEILIKKLNNILLITEDLEEIYPLIDKADIMIRPSYTDGDSVSVREALHFNTYVITSDAIPRPKGCILFETRNQSDFDKKVFNLLEITLNDKIEKKKKVKTESNAEKILEVYKNLLNDTRIRF